MICKFCGEELPDNARFCGSCGSRLDEETTTEQAVNVVDTNTTTEPVNNDIQDPQAGSGNATIPLSMPTTTTPATNASAGNNGGAADKAKKAPKPLIFGLVIGLIAVAIVAAIVVIGSVGRKGLAPNNSYGDNYENNYENNGEAPVQVDSNMFIVYFEPNNGAPAIQVEMYSGLIQEPVAPVRDGFVFDGWYDASMQNKWDFAVNEASGTMRLYAKWTEEVTKYAENEKLVIAGDGLRLRATPDLAGQKIGLIPNGTRITVLDTVDGWAYTTYKGISGWCSSDFLYNPADYEGQVLFKAYVDNRNGITLYVNEDVNSTVINSYIGYKSTVYVYEVDDEWSYVCYGNQFGWCLSEYLDDF